MAKLGRQVTTYANVGYAELQARVPAHGGSLMGGQVIDVQVECLIETSDGPRRVTVNLESIRSHCRPERVEDLIEDLLMLCEDVQARRRPKDSGRPTLALDRSLRRIK
jgi:hypothetical protein